MNILVKSKKKPTAKQLAARKLFVMRVKRGDFKKKKKSSTNSKPKKLVNRVKPSKTRRNRGGSASDIDKSLLLAIKDPNIKEIIIRK